jgi:hypothetical protein
MDKFLNRELIEKVGLTPEEEERLDGTLCRVMLYSILGMEQTYEDGKFLLGILERTLPFSTMSAEIETAHQNLKKMVEAHEAADHRKDKDSDTEGDEASADSGDAA